MSSSHFVVSFRSLWREKAYATINTVGLAAGIACFVVLALYLESELSYDKHNLQHKQIYRVAVELDTRGKIDLAAMSPRTLGELLQQDYPEVLDFVRFEPSSQTRQQVTYGDIKLYWDDVFLVDPNIFDVFTHEIIYGDPTTALDDPLSVAISETAAKAYFGDANPIGETLEFETAVYNVSLVFADLPQNTHMSYHLLLSYNRLKAFFPPDMPSATQQLWNIADYTYLVMPEGYDLIDFDAVSRDFYDRYMAETGRQLGSKMKFMLEPLADVHYFSKAQYDRPSGNVFYLYAFGAIGVFVLLVACINYMNLATARSSKRAREVGMRKLLGANRTNLIGQFLAESMLFALSATALAVLLVWGALRFAGVDGLLGVELSLDFLERPVLLLALLGLALFVGLLSGLYPAFYLSTIRPIAALQGGVRGGRDKAGAFRQVLVLIQFTISVGVIACTVLMALQMDYVRNRPLGFDKENQIIVRMVGADVIEKTQFIKNELTALPGVIGVSTSESLPGDQISINLLEAQTDAGEFEAQTFNRMGVDQDFFAAMGIEVLAGRNFGDDTPDESSVLVNETAVKTMGWNDPIGKRINSGPFKNVIIGVVSDFHFHSLHRKIEPLFVHTLTTDFSEVSELNRRIVRRAMIIKVTEQGARDVITFLRENWPSYDPKHLLEYSFLDESLNRIYANEDRQMKLIGLFAAVCILISCLGLFGLSAFTTEQRTKEIGIRKILGASTVQIILMLFRRISWVIAVASLVAAAISYYIVDLWLAGFEYRLAINWLVFVGAAAMAAALAFATVAGQAYRTASSSPATALRYE